MKSKILLETNLQSFFYRRLVEINKTSTIPLPDESLYYSSNVLEKYNNPEVLFELSESGELKEKILGIKLLESQSLESEAKKRSLKDIADTALVICGYFPPSQKKKLVDISYYKKVGMSAYNQLNNVMPNFLDIQNFYLSMANMFERLSSTINILSSEMLDNVDIHKQYSILIDKDDKLAS